MSVYPREPKSSQTGPLRDLSDRAQTLTVEEVNVLKEAAVRRHITYAIVAAFLCVNILTYLGIGLIYLGDQSDLAAHLVAPGERIIGTSIVATVVGATTVQLGALAILESKLLFPRDISTTAAIGALSLVRDE